MKIIRTTPPAGSVSSNNGTRAYTPPSRISDTAYLLPYKATPRDSIDADGLPVEYIICWEEFQEGDSLGRMPCFCLFHEVCIAMSKHQPVTNLYI